MLRKLLLKIQDFFGISPKESRGALVLIVLSFVLLWTPSVVKWWVLPLFQDETPPFTIETLDSAAAQLPDRPSSTQSRNYADAEEIERPSRLFAFDPNTASPVQLQELGIPRFLALRIQKYREKGGKFRHPEDLQKIYDFPPALYGRLAPYIRLEGANSSLAEAAGTDAGNPAPRDDKGLPLPREIKAYGRAVPVPFDINTTDTTQLATLKGIGSKLSLRIVKFRDALGGFHSPDQYPEVFGLDSVALSELRRYARVQSSPRKIAINSASVEELYRHPYLRNKRLNEVIVRYREQHGPYATPESLKGIRIMDEATLRKIAPYLSF